MQDEGQIWARCGRNGSDLNASNLRCYGNVQERVGNIDYFKRAALEAVL